MVKFHVENKLCYHCKGAHSSDSMQCKYKVETELIATQMKERTTYSIAKQIVLERSPEHDRLYSAVVNSDVERGGTEERNRGANSKRTNQANKEKTFEERIQQAGSSTEQSRGRKIDRVEESGETDREVKLLQTCSRLESQIEVANSRKEQNVDSTADELLESKEIRQRGSGRKPISIKTA